jgi:hypothetical protein
MKGIERTIKYRQSKEDYDQFRQKDVAKAIGNRGW